MSEYIPNGCIGERWLNSTKHHNWKGGITNSSDGYIQVHRPDHPFADKAGVMQYHRIVYESFHKCGLLPWADVHHIDNNRRNNFPSNLQAMMHSEHASLPNPNKKNLGNRNGMYGKKHSPESIRKMRGRKRSPESRKQMSESKRKGFLNGTIVPWNKGKKGLQVAWNKGLKKKN